MQLKKHKQYKLFLLLLIKYKQTSRSSPLSRSEVARGASAQVAPVGVRAAELAGVGGGGALVDVGAAAGPLLVVEAGGTQATEAAQGVVARSSAADLGIQALVLIWDGDRDRKKTAQRSVRRKAKHTMLGNAIKRLTV